MASDDFDRAEIDRLVEELADAAETGGAKRRLRLFPRHRRETAQPAPPSQALGSPASGRSWTTAQVLMPAAMTRRRSSLGAMPVSPSPLRRYPASHPDVKRSPCRTCNDEWGTVTVRMFVALGVLLSAAMPYWPYSHAWSWGLLLYLAAVELIVVTGIWGAKLTWDAHLPAAHTVAIGTVIWGLGLIVWETAPRLAYIYA